MQYKVINSKTGKRIAVCDSYPKAMQVKGNNKDLVIVEKKNFLGR